MRKFLHLFHKEIEFGNIEGYDDIKDIVRRALHSYENYNLLLCGPPVSAKTLFLHGILECRNGVDDDVPSPLGDGSPEPAIPPLGGRLLASTLFDKPTPTKATKDSIIKLILSISSM